MPLGGYLAMFEITFQLCQDYTIHESGKVSFQNMAQQF